MYRAVASLILEDFDESSSGNEDVPEGAADEDFCFVPFMNHLI